ncbi:MAG: hypothetical protein HKM92_09520 [Arenibacter sp.]|nr:hypothetical protein [Arenibacter sp.]
MISLLFANKTKTTTGKILNYDNKSSFYSFLEGLLTDIGKALSKKPKVDIMETSTQVKSKNTHFGTTPSNELQKIALNQLTYSKLMEEKMQKINLERTKA